MDSGVKTFEGTNSVGTPRVSVVIPAYEAAMFISRALESVFHQTLSGWEAIVINDGSTDTRELESALRPFLDRITYIKQENAGPAAARNRGIQIARGELLAFLDADDYWDSRFLEEQVGFLDTNPTVDLVYCDGLLFGEDPRAGRRFMEITDQTADPTFLSLVSGRASVITSGTVVWKSRVEQVGGFDGTLRTSEDFDLWIRLARSGSKLAARTNVLVHRRFHGENLTRDSTRMTLGVIAVLEKVTETESLNVTERAAVEQMLRTLRADLVLGRGKVSLRNREFQRARSEVAEANRIQPRFKLKFVLFALRVAPKLLYHLDYLRLLRLGLYPNRARDEE